MQNVSNRFTRPAAWYDRLVAREDNWEDCEGVPLAIGSLKDEPAFRQQIAAALQLIARHSPADFARLQHLMRGIVVARLYGALAEWRKALDVCIVSTRFLRRETTSSAVVASTIVHELMHARLDALGFGYGETHRARVEHICFRASRRFLERLPPSLERDTAIQSVEDYLALDASVWSDSAFRDMNAEQPWYVRALRFVLRLGQPTSHRKAPT